MPRTDVGSRFWCSVFFFFKQKTAYERRISDWSSDVCSSDLCTTGFMPAEEGRSQANLDRPTQDPPISFRNGSWSLLRRCVAWPHTEPPYRTGTLRCSSNVRWSDSSPRTGPAMHCPHPEVQCEHQRW